MKCLKVSRRLSTYIDGELSWRETGGLEEHLKICDSCRRKLADLKLVSQTAADLERVSAGPHFTNRVICALSIQRSSNSILIGWRYRMALSGVAFVVAGGLAFLFLAPLKPTGLFPSAIVESDSTSQPNSAIQQKGFEVSDEALQRDMALTNRPETGPAQGDSVVLPKHFVQPVGIKRSAEDEVVY